MKRSNIRTQAVHTWSFLASFLGPYYQTRCQSWVFGSTQDCVRLPSYSLHFSAGCQLVSPYLPYLFGWSWVVIFLLQSQTTNRERNPLASPSPVHVSHRIRRQYALCPVSLSLSLSVTCECVLIQHCDTIIIVGGEFISYWPTLSHSGLQA